MDHFVKEQTRKNAKAAKKMKNMFKAAGLDTDATELASSSDNQSDSQNDDDYDDENDSGTYDSSSDDDEE